jgi:hypothetical protein
MRRYVCDGGGCCGGNCGPDAAVIAETQGFDVYVYGFLCIKGRKLRFPAAGLHDNGV